MTRYKTQIWTGPTEVNAWADRCRKRFGHANVLVGTEHVYVINQDAANTGDVVERLLSVFSSWRASDVRISVQNAPMRAACVSECCGLPLAPAYDRGGWDACTGCGMI